MNDLRDKVKWLVIHEVGMPENDFGFFNTFEAMGADSLDDVLLVMAVEAEFDVEISDADWEKIITPEQIVEYLEKL